MENVILIWMWMNAATTFMGRGFVECVFNINPLDFNGLCLIVIRQHVFGDDFPP